MDSSHSFSSGQKRHSVGCYYFPNYHIDPRNEKTHGQGWAEWELVKHAKPRFQGHDQPKIPLWGYTDESNPDVMAQKIDAAADHGIDFFIFDWYYYDDGPYLEGGVERGFMCAPNNHKMKFCCMWANHDWLNIHPCGLKTGGELLYPGRVLPDTFQKITSIMIEKYFSHSSYFTVDGKPYFSIYDLTRFIEIFGSVDATRRAMDVFRSAAQQKGFPDIHLNAVVWGKPVLPSEDIIPNLPDLITQLGFDSTTSYVWIHHAHLEQSPATPYLSVMEKYFEHWDQMKQDYAIPYYPNVTMGWDSSPRTLQSDIWMREKGYPFMNVIGENTPENFRIALKKTKEHLDAAGKSSIFNINCWNEWTEGSYLEPDHKHGLAYLDAVKAVFGKTTPNAISNSVTS